MKTVEIYKYLLSSFVYSDAKHDFNNVNKFYDKYKNSIKDSIPNAPYTEYSEDGLLNSIKITHINNKPNTINFTFDKLLNEYQSSSITEINFLIGNRIKRKYDMKVISYQKGNILNANPEDFLYYFEGLRTFIIDSFNLKFFDGFKNTNDNSYFNKNNTFYVLYNREMQNDPANKGNLDTKYHFPVGYRIKDVYDNDNRDIKYNKWTDSELTYLNMFYSNYNITLTNRFNINDQNNCKNDVSLIIDNDVISKKYDNLKISNSITKLIEQSLLGKISPSIAFLRKRSGDSLQILSVLDNNRILYSNDSFDASDKIHDNPKIFITLDRTALYYSLLIGIDIGFTIKRCITGNTNNYYLITFINRNNDHVLNTLSYNYSKNNIVGGRNIPKRNMSIKLKNNNRIKFRLNKTIKARNMSNNIQDIYNQIVLSEIKSYIIKDKIEINYLDSIINSSKYIYNNSKNKAYVVKYILTKNNVEYSTEYISKIIFEEYVQLIHRYSLNYDEYKSYYSKISNISDIIIFYKHYTYHQIINKIILYYDINNNIIANNIRSLNCMLYIINLYYNMEADNTFNNYNKYKLKELMNHTLQKLYNEQTSFEFNSNSDKIESDSAAYSNTSMKEYIENDRIDQLIQIIVKIVKEEDPNNINTKEIRKIYEQICFTSDWNFVDLTRIIIYILENNLDLYDTLIKLAGDYYHSMYVSKPAMPGIQSIATMILTQHGYNFDNKRIREPEIQVMIDNIYSIKCDGYIFEYKLVLDNILELFKTTFKKYFIWGLEIV